MKDYKLEDFERNNLIQKMPHVWKYVLYLEGVEDVAKALQVDHNLDAICYCILCKALNKKYKILGDQ